MPRKESTNYVAPTVHRLNSYHGSEFQSLKFFNSDRPVKITDNYTVSADNTPSTLTIMKEGAHIKAFGIEWELMSRIADAVGTTVLVNVLELAFSKAGFPEDFWRIEADGTVSAECVTQTFSQSWLENNFKCFKALYEIASKLEFTTDSQNCGMHVNIDLSNFGTTEEKQLENVRKLGYLINKHYDFFKVAVYRMGRTTWCPRMNSTKEYWKNTPVRQFPTRHDECCINMGHVNEGRVEIRLVGGQKNYACFRNTMELVFHIIKAVKKLSWNDLDDLTKVFKGCNYHVADRIVSNCVASGVISPETASIIKANSTTERFL